MKKRVSMLLTGLCLLLVFCGSACADITFVTSDYTNGTLGVISAVDGELKVTGNRAANLKGDTIAFSYAFGDNLLVTERNTTGNDGIYIYDPADLSKPMHNTTWANASNIYDAEYFMGYLYVICYNGKIIKVETSGYTKVGEWSFDNVGLDAGFTGKGVSLAQKGEELYALFTVADANYPPAYKKSKLICLTDGLVEQERLDLPENTHTVTEHNGTLYAASWGGSQGSGTDASLSLLQRIDTGTAPMEAVTLFNGGAVDGGQIAYLCFNSDGAALIATHKYDADFNTTANLYMLDTQLDVSAKKLLKTLDGWSTQIVYDSVTRYFWVANSNGQNGPDQILAFDRGTGSQVKSFSAAELGGPVYFMAAVKKTTADTESGGSGGGCAAGGYGILALLWGFPLLLRKKTGHKGS